MVDWKRKLQIKVWGAQEFNFDWIDVKEIKEAVGGYLVYEAKDTIPWHVRRDGTIWRGHNQIGLVRNKRTVDDNTKKINQKSDNRAVFYFERKGDVYTLKGWKNVMSYDIIEKKYPRSVAHDYWSWTDDIGFVQFKNAGQDCILLYEDKETKVSAKFIYAGNTFTKEEYENLVKVLKACGRRFSKLIRDSKKPEKIEVVI